MRCAIRRAADAARHAGYAWGTSRHAGWRLLQDPRIRRRIRMLQEFAHEHRPKTREELGVRLETVYRECMNRGQYHAAVRALDGVREKPLLDAYIVSVDCTAGSVTPADLETAAEVATIYEEIVEKPAR